MLNLLFIVCLFCSTPAEVSSPGKCFNCLKDILLFNESDLLLLCLSINIFVTVP